MGKMLSVTALLRESPKNRNTELIASAFPRDKNSLLIFKVGCARVLTKISRHCATVMIRTDLTERFYVTQYPVVA